MRALLFILIPSMTEASAPGKVILFGEHAVVYGKPAIACAINKRIYVKVERARKGEIKAEARDLRYVEKSIEIAKEHFDVNESLKVEISSELPVASGLGSSAAVSVATIAAIAKEFNKEAEKKEIAELAYRVEKEVQGRASRTDTTTSAFGGIMFIEGNRIERISNAKLSFVIGDSMIEKSTKELVEKVRKLKEKYEEIGMVMDCIGKITYKARGIIEELSKNENEEEKEKKLIALGELMNINHGLLEALGIGNEALSKLVYAARKGNALGAKITGAGGGGCIVALARDEKTRSEIAKEIEKLGFRAIVAEVYGEGVKTD